MSNLLLVRTYLHHLSKEQFGLWSLALVLYVAVQQISVSFVPALIKAIAEAAHSDDSKLARSYVVTCAALVGAVLVALGPLLPVLTSVTAGVFVVPATYAAQWKRLIPAVCVLAAVYLTGEISLAYITARGKITWTHALNSVGIVSSLTASTILFRIRPDVLNIPLGLITGRSVLLLASLVALKRLRFGRAHIAEVQNRNLVAIGRIGYLYFAGALLSLCLFPASKAILVRTAGLTAVAAFEIAYTFSLQLRNVIDVAMRGVLPEVAAINARMRGRLTAEAGDSALAGLVRRYTLIALASSVVVCGTGYLLSPVFFRIIGAHFGPSLGGTLGILLVGGCLNAIGIPHFYTLMGLGQGGRILNSYLILAGTNILGLITLAAAFRMTEVGAAWAVLFSMLTSTIYLMYSTAQFTGWRLPASFGIRALASTNE